MTHDFLLFSGTANPTLAIGAELGIRSRVHDVAPNPGGETAVRLGASVRGREVLVVPIAPLIAGAIRRLHAGGSLGDLFQSAPTTCARIPH